MMLPLLVFVCGAAHEAACVAWVHFSERGRALPAAVCAALSASATLTGVLSAVTDWRIAPYYVVGLGVGTFVAVRIKHLRWALPTISLEEAQMDARLAALKVAAAENRVVAYRKAEDARVAAMDARIAALKIDIRDEDEDERARHEDERAKITAGVCPACNESGLERRVDLRQTGKKPREDVWVANYRHSCGFARDYVEPEGRS